MTPPTNALSALVLSEVAAFVLAVARVAGFVLVSPFPGKHVANKPKIGLILMLAFLARAASPPSAAFSLDPSLLEVIPGELGIGLVMGFTVRVTFSAAELLGANLAQATGLTMGQVYDPTLGGEDPVLSRLVSMFAMVLFLAIGAHRVAIGYLIGTFHLLPIGHHADISAAAPSLVGFVGESMDAGLRLSLPVVAVGLSVQITLALVARASPSLQVFNVGMGIAVAAGLLAILATVDDSWRAGLGAELQREVPRLEQVLEDVSTPPRK